MRGRKREKEGGRERAASFVYKILMSFDMPRRLYSVCAEATNGDPFFSILPQVLCSVLTHVRLIHISIALCFFSLM